jgi:hypothetical protein
MIEARVPGEILIVIGNGNPKLVLLREIMASGCMMDEKAVSFESANHHFWFHCR